MAKLKGQIAKVLKKIGAVDAALVVARQRQARCHTIAVKAYERSVELGKRADRARKEGRLGAAKRLDNRAQRKHRRSIKAAAKSQQWIARVKSLLQRKLDLGARKDELEEEMRKALSESKVTIEGNKATGGSRRARLKAVALAAAARCASGRRANFYSQAGAWDPDHAITGEGRGERSDCSQFVTAVYKSAGLPDPNGNNFKGGYTGTLGAHGKEISRSDLKPGDLILYGSFPHHHVEMYVGPGDKTIGHGSAPVDPGVIDLISGPKTYRSYVN